MKRLSKLITLMMLIACMGILLVQPIFAGNGNPPTRAAHKVTFDKNGGSGIAPVSKTYEAGESVDLSKKGTLSRMMHDFLGWNTSRDANTPLKEFIMPDNDVTLYAVWERKSIFGFDLFKKYGIHFEGNGHTEGNPPADKEYFKGWIVLLPRAWDMVKDGHEFVGWGTTATSTKPVRRLFTMPAENLTFYAIWKQNPTDYELSFDGNRNTHGTPPASVRYAPGADVIFPDAGSLVKDGYDFLGWNTSRLALTPLTEYKMPSKDAKLYAVWRRATKKYTLSFDGNKSDSGSLPEEKQYPRGAVVPLPGGGDLKRLGYTFKGWNTNRNSKNTLSSFEMPARNATLYAIWEKDPNAAPGQDSNIDFKKCDLPKLKFPDMKLEMGTHMKAYLASQGKGQPAAIGSKTTPKTEIKSTAVAVAGVLSAVSIAVLIIAGRKKRTDS